MLENDWIYVIVSCSNSNKQEVGFRLFKENLDRVFKSSDLRILIDPEFKILIDNWGKLQLNEYLSRDELKELCRGIK